jgi:hypothetical protein
VLPEHVVHCLGLSFDFDIELGLQHFIQFVLLVESGLAEQVITAARERVFQDFLRLLNLNELFCCVKFKVLIGVVLAALSAICFLELSFGKRCAFKLKKFVEIFLLL